MPPGRSDARLLVSAGGAVLLAGVLVAVILLFATGRGGTPSRNQPFLAGIEANLKANLKDGGPYYVPDPFGGRRSILFALEDGEVVALSTVLPGTKDCHVKWKAQFDRFVDCRGGRHVSTDLDRYETFVDTVGRNRGALFVELRNKVPAPGVPTAG